MDTKEMYAGQEVLVTAGPFEGHTVTVVNPKAVPDGEPNQRKVLVSDEDGNEFYVLPRLITTPGFQRAHVPVPIVGETAPMPQVQVRESSGQPIAQAVPITDPMDPALDRFRPDASVVKRYTNRVMKNGMTDVEFLLTFRDMRDANDYMPNIALVGETQSGKTMLVQVLAVVAAERDGLPKPYPIFTISGSAGVTNYDLYGQTTAVIVNGQEVLVWMDGLVPMACRCGGFLYLDEWNAVHANQAVGIHPVLDDRRQFINTHRAVPDGHGGYAPEVVKANTNTWCIATINPSSYRGVQQMAEATSNRFRWIPWDYDEKVESKVIPSATVQAIGKKVRAMHTETPVGTSALIRLCQDAGVFGADMAFDIFLGMFNAEDRDNVSTAVWDGPLADAFRAEYPGTINS
jgi:AAA domain (dynein-related subfamily)